MAYHPCPRCGRLVPVGVSYCMDCKPQAEQQAMEAMERKRAYKRAAYNREYNRRRDPKYTAFYNSKEWRTLSRARLQACRYKCEARLDGCTRRAVEVHHVKPIKTADGWDQRLEFAGLIGVCINCHNILDGKTFKQRRDPGVIDMSTIQL